MGSIRLLVIESVSIDVSLLQRCECSVFIENLNPIIILIDQEDQINTVKLISMAGFELLY